MQIPEHQKIVALDVKSLLTNIPKDLVLKNIKIGWFKIREYTYILIQQFLEIILFCLDNAYLLHLPE